MTFAFGVCGRIERFFSSLSKHAAQRNRTSRVKRIVCARAHSNAVPVERYACKLPGTDDLGDPCLSNAECNPTASDLGVYCCLDSEKCGPNFEECVEDCSTFSSGGEVGTFEGALCVDNSECGESLFCCLVPDPSGNCDFGNDESCTCRSTQN